jgi:hypothetical protein
VSYQLVRCEKKTKKNYSSIVCRTADFEMNSYSFDDQNLFNDMHQVEIPTTECRIFKNTAFRRKYVRTAEKNIYACYIVSSFFFFLYLLYTFVMSCFFFLLPDF